MSERVYLGLVQDLSGLLEEARRSSARAVNVVMTATYWEIGRRIVEFEQGGEPRAEYGTALLARLARDLAGRFGRGFSRPNLQRFREFYLQFPEKKICSTPSSKSGESTHAQGFLLPNRPEDEALRLPSKVADQTPPSNIQRRSALSFRTAICHSFNFPSTRIR